MLFIWQIILDINSILPKKNLFIWTEVIALLNKTLMRCCLCTLVSHVLIWWHDQPVYYILLDNTILKSVYYFKLFVNGAFHLLIFIFSKYTELNYCPEAVSYTHLDVYKRQAFTHTSKILVYTLSVTFVCVCTSIQVETPVHIFVWAKLAIPDMLISNTLLIIYSLLGKFKFLYSMLSTSLICTVALFLCLVTKKI